MITNIFLLFLICFLIIVILKKMNKKLNLDLVSDKKIWETLNTYWPMNPYFGSECTVKDNLYCEDGCLDKYDKPYEIEVNALLTDKLFDIRDTIQLIRN